MWLNSRDNNGRTPLHLAVIHNNLSAYQQLVNLHSDTQLADYNSFTPAIYALFCDRSAIFNLNIPSQLDVNHFNRLRLLLCNAKEFSNMNNEQRNMLISEYSYKLIRLFKTIEKVTLFLEKYLDLQSSQPIHNLCLFNLPTHDEWHDTAWADLIMSEGLDVQKHLTLADRIEALLGRPPLNLLELEAVALKIQYNRKNENNALAELFITHLIPEISFEYVLDNYSPKKNDNLPDIFINGNDIGCAKFYLKKLPVSDLSGFILGAMTACCQSIGSAGEACAWHGMTSIYGGFYIIVKKSRAKQITEYVEIAQGAESYQHFLELLTDNSAKEQYRKERETIKLKLKKYQRTNEQLLLKELIEQLQEKITHLTEQDYKDEIVAQCWAWIGK